MDNAWILVPFTRDYSQKVHASKLARLVNASQKTVARKLEQLEQMYLLNFVREGRNKSYFLDLKKGSSWSILQILENYKEINFMLSSQKLFPLLLELSNICSLILFGSYAKGIAKEDSDLDLVILSKKTKEIVKIVEKYPYQVNAHYVDLAFLEKRLKEGWPLAKEIVKDHILFGEKEKIIKIFLRYSQR